MFVKTVKKRNKYSPRTFEYPCLVENPMKSQRLVLVLMLLFSPVSLLLAQGTRLLRQPTVSSEEIAFVYVVDLPNAPRVNVEKAAEIV